MPDDKKVSELTEETSIVATDLFYLAKDLGGGVFGERKMQADNIVPLTTKGDILVHNATVLARVPVGTDGFFLKADSGVGAGVSWAAELFTSAKDTKLTNIEALADVTDAGNVGAVATLDSDYVNDSLRYKNSAGGMANVVLANDELLGNPVAGEITGFNATAIRTLINVENASTADQTDAEIKTAYENNANTNEFSDTEQTKLTNIEALADVTDATNVNAAGAVMESDFANNTVRFKNNAGVMGNITLAASQILGRKATGEIDNLTAAETRTILNVENGSTADQTNAEIKTAYEANADTNEFSDSEQSKLAAIEPLADVTDATNVNAAGAVMESDFAANSLRFKNNSSVMGNIVVLASQLVGRASTGEVRNLNATESRTLLNVENNADVTDAANVNSAGAVMESDFANNSVRFKNNAGVMGNIVLAASQILGRKSTGEIDNLTAAETRTILNVENNADVTDTANVTSAGALMDSEVDADIKTLVLPANTTISAFGRTLVDDAAAINGRATLGVVIGTDVLPEIPLVTQGLAEGGTDTAERTWSALRVKQAIDALQSGTLVLLATVTASASATIDFDTGLDWTTYKKYIFELIDVVPATDLQDFYIRTSTDNGTGYDEVSTDYAWAYYRTTGGNTTATLRASGSDAKINITTANGWGSAAGEAINGTLILYNPSSTRKTIISLSIHGVNPSGELQAAIGSGMRNIAADVDGVRFLMSSGNITSGTFKMYGVL